MTAIYNQNSLENKYEESRPVLNKVIIAASVVAIAAIATLVLALTGVIPGSAVVTALVVSSLLGASSAATAMTLGAIKYLFEQIFLDHQGDKPRSDLRAPIIS